MLVASEWANCKRDKIVDGDRMLCVEMLCLLLLRLMIERCIPLIPCKNINSPDYMKETYLLLDAGGECSGLGCGRVWRYLYRPD